MKRWLIPTLVLTVGLTLVAYLQFEQIRTRKESDRNLARLAGLAAEPVLLGLNQQLDLEWVRAFPQLQGLEVSNLEGKVLQTFGTPGQGQTLTVRSAGQAIGNLKISTVSTPWNPLPLFAVLAMAALTLIPTP